VKAVVVGAGRWGTVFTWLLARRGHDVCLACRDPDQVAAIAATGRNPRAFRGLELTGVAAVALPDSALAAADLVVVAVPSNAFADVAESLGGADARVLEHKRNAPVLMLTKGLDPASGSRLSTLLTGRTVAALSGPNFAAEIAAGLPAAAVVASEDPDLARMLQDELATPDFRIYLNADLTGVELCAAAKNVIALAAGAVDGLGLGDNAKAALITRGLAELSRLGSACGGRPETFAGLAGMGDLTATCWSRHGRNRRAGELIARGAAPGDAVAAVGTVEGAVTAPVLLTLAGRLGIDLPITESVCRILEGAPSRDLVASLMGRPPTTE
jgi:glycerol-3-phosphate dehydrogenase (NAD(P)+)